MMRFRLLIYSILLSVAWSLTAVQFSNCVENPESPLFKATSVEASYSHLDSHGKRTITYHVTGDVTGSDIVDLNETTSEYTTLHVYSSILNYEIHNKYAQFCNYVDGSCPLNINEKRSFNYSFELDDYQLVEFDTTLSIKNPSGNGLIGCVTVQASPVLASYVWYPIAFGVVTILVSLILIYILSSLLNPWTGTFNIYLFSTNYQYSAEAIRLITPGITDFIYYIQFIFLTGALSLIYPTFYQPVLATVSWSCLLFHFNYVSNTSIHFDDNLYNDIGRYGISRLMRNVGLRTDGDIWPTFIVWFLIVCGMVVVLTLGLSSIHGIISRMNKTDKKFFSNGDDTLNQDTSYDLEKYSFKPSLSKNPFLLVTGMIIRLVIRVFSLPIVALGFYQIYIINRFSSVSVSEIFCILSFITWLALAGYSLYRTLKFPLYQLEELPNKLVWGSLYNVYITGSRPYFATLELMIKFFQGLTIGLIQESGLAQLIILILLEIFSFFGTLCLQPFDKITSMNLITLFLALAKMITLCLMFPFITELETSESVKEWLGYAVLIIHACIILLFFVHALQVAVELILWRGRLPIASSNPETSRIIKGNSTNRQSSLLEPVSPSENKTIDSNYYRRPRGQSFAKKSLTHDRYSRSDDNTLINEDTIDNEFEFVKKHNSQTGRVNYAVREADIYITKRSSELSDSESVSGWSKRSSGLMRKSTDWGSQNVIYDVHAEEEENEIEQNGGMESRKNFNDLSTNKASSSKSGNRVGPMSKLFNRVKNVKQGHSSDKNTSSSGFEVLRRPRIIPQNMNESSQPLVGSRDDNESS